MDLYKLTLDCREESSGNFLHKTFVFSKKSRTFAPELEISRSGAVGSSLGS